MKKLKQRFTSLFQRFKELQGDPAYLARGAAIGVLVGFAPISPLKAVTILAVTTIIPSSAVAGILVSTLICNPFTYVPLYYFAWKIGNFLMPGRASWELLETTLQQMQQSGLLDGVMLAGQVGFDTLVVILAGGCLMAVPFALLSYPIAHRLFVKLSKYQKNNNNQEISS